MSTADYFCDELTITTQYNEDRTEMSTFINEPLPEVYRDQRTLDLISSEGQTTHYELVSIIVLVTEVYENNKNVTHLVSYNKLFPTYGQYIPHPEVNILSISLRQ